MSRRKVSCLECWKWSDEHIHLCALCEKKAEYRLNFFSGLNHGVYNLCEEHNRQWNKGELYL